MTGKQDRHHLAPFDLLVRSDSCKVASIFVINDFIVVRNRFCDSNISVLSCMPNKTNEANINRGALSLEADPTAIIAKRENKTRYLPKLAFPSGAFVFLPPLANLWVHFGGNERKALFSRSFQASLPYFF